MGVPTADTGPQTMGRPMAEHESASRASLYQWTIQAFQSKRRVGYALMALAGVGLMTAGLITVIPTFMTPQGPATMPAPLEPKTADQPLSSIDREASPFAEVPGTSTNVNPSFRPASGGTPPVPVDTLSGVATGKLPAKALASPGAAPKLITKPDPEKVRAVILDASTPKSEKSTIAESKPRAANAPSTPLAQASNVTATPAASGTKGDATRPVAAATKITIVDIAEDGSYVLVTDPETRLPRKYTTGQQLFTGEQILKIEPDKSRIQLPGRYVAIQ